MKKNIKLILLVLIITIFSAFTVFSLDFNVNCPNSFAQGEEVVCPISMADSSTTLSSLNINVDVEGASGVEMEYEGSVFEAETGPTVFAFSKLTGAPYSGTAPFAELIITPSASEVKVAITGTSGWNGDGSVEYTVLNFPLQQTITQQQAQICTAGAHRCSGGNKQTCNGAGTAWENNACETGKVCRGAGVCTNVVCTNGEKRCSSGQPEVCTNQGTIWYPGTTCTDNQICQNGDCVTASCTAGETRCTSNLAQIETCKADRTGWDRGSCPNDATCKNGDCVAPTCEDGIKNQDETGVDCGGSCSESCNTPCVDADDWDITSEWNVCSESCGGGIQTRTVAPKECTGNGGRPATRQDCNTQACPVARTIGSEIDDKLLEEGINPASFTESKDWDSSLISEIAGMLKRFWDGIFT